MTAWMHKIHAPKKNLGVHLLSFFLYLLSLFYGLWMSIRNYLYDRSWIKAYHSQAKVISIGNIVVGGVGKTPLTLKVAEHFLKRGIPLAVLSRGYKSECEHRKTPTILSRGKGPELSSKQAGDEPYLISKRIPKSLFVIGKNRVESAKLAEKLGGKILLLDDAMQHRRIHRDLEIVVLDAQDPFGKDYLLPRGLLRESKKALTRAGLIIVNHAPESQERCRLVDSLKSITKAPILFTKVKVVGYFNLEDQEIPSLRGQKVGAFCGLGKPHYFYKSLLQENVQAVLKKSLADHKQISTAQLEQFCFQSFQLGAKAVVCTEKDAVKILKPIKTPIPIVQLKVELDFLEGEDALNDMLKKNELFKRFL
ncbi:MAG: Tetraacyldisaccharide 4'-kinase [Chlamydiae bacterium]|nr:Tetraacyldisaccharide 4'-kinase [Chlamydiota bacterium]